MILGLASIRREIATKHYAHLVFKAAEKRVAMVKSDGSGTNSAIIDPWGRVAKRAVTPDGADPDAFHDVAENARSANPYIAGAEAGI